MNRKHFALDSLLIFLFAAILIWPLFKVKYVDNWGSIESTFIADARFLKDHWPHPQWQPLWYGGTRFDYVYPPALRYGTAFIAKMYPRMTEARAYHLYTAFFYCLGIVGVYWFVCLIGGHRRSGWLAAIACAIVSPCFLVLPGFRLDSFFLAPQRLGVLVRYGEGPHMTALALLPIALAVSFRALAAWRPLALAGAAALCALLVSNNFYGATALAYCYPILVWCVWITRDDRWIPVRAAAIALLAYGLTASWLTPDYLRITLDNLKLVAKPGNANSLWVMLAAAAAYCALTYRTVRGRPERLYPALLTGTALLFSLIVLGFFKFNFRISGEPSRMVPEFDLAIILLSVEMLRYLWTRYPSALVRGACAVLVLASFAPSYTYFLAPHASIRPYDNHRDRVEYKLSEWMWRNHPQSRAFVTGSVRFWYDAWFDLPHMGGGSEQGLINQRIFQGVWRVREERNVANALPLLQCFGVDYLVAHEAKSQEVYKDLENPRKYAELLTQVYDDGAGNLIYQVPRRYPSLARVVDTAQLARIPTPGADLAPAITAAYVEAMEKGPPQPATLTWQGTDAFRLRAQVSEGQSLTAMVTYDPAFHAYAQGKPIPIQPDVLGQMHFNVPPGNADLTVVFERPLQNTIGLLLTATSLLTLVGLCWLAKPPFRMN